MGIPSYFSFIIRNYSNILKNMDFFTPSDNKIHALLMDCNSIIYDSLRDMQEEEYKGNIDKELIARTIKKIEYYIYLIKPSKYVYITFDGQAPTAKVKQQRYRRVMSNILTKDKKVYWDKNNITFGTKFMEDLNRQVYHHFRNKQYGMKIFISCSDEFGEGEHKLMDFIRDFNMKNDNVVIYGLDSDLIMLSIFQSHLCKSIYVFREAPQFLKSSIPSSIINKDEIYFVDIKLLMNYIVEEIGDTDIHRAYDYVFFCFFLGNDFLPHIPCLNIRTNGFDILYNIYKKTFSNTDNYLINKDFEIDWNNVKRMFSEIYKIEEKMLVEEYTNRKKFSRYRIDFSCEKGIEDYVQNIPCFFRYSEQYINPCQPYWEARYNKLILKTKDENEIMNIVNDYKNGLQWVFNYYIKGQCNELWYWKYSQGPLVKNIKHMNNKPVEKIICNHPEIVLGNYQLDECENLSWEFKKYLWEGHIVSV